MEYINLPKVSGVYCITNIKTGAQYVGSSVNIYRRIYEHKRHLEKGEHHSNYLQRSWNTHGGESFVAEVLEEVLNIEVLIEREQFYIDNLSTKYNMTPTAGSNLGRKASPEQIERMREIAINLWQDEAFRIKYSESRKKLLDETNLREVMSIAGLKRHADNPDHAINHSRIMKEKWSDPEYHHKMCESRKDSHNKEEFKVRMSQEKLLQYANPEFNAKQRHLSMEQAKFVLIQIKFGFKQREIANFLGVTKHVIKDISRGRTYKHINRETLEIDWSLAE